MIDQHAIRLEKFKRNLRDLSPAEVVRKHITTGTPVVFSEEAYFGLRSLVAKEFQLHPSAVVLVGSCRTGFSIVKRKRYHPARDFADLDVAMVSKQRFDAYWDNVFLYAYQDRAWKKSGTYEKFVRMLFEGWIDPRGLPAVPIFHSAGHWTNFFDELMQSRQFGSRRITARLYRSWVYWFSGKWTLAGLG